MEIQDFIIIIGLTTILTTASTTIIMLKIKDDLKKDICNQITDLLIRVGVLESKHA